MHDINPLRFEFIKARCELQDAAILDVGCGGGLLTESLAKAGGRVEGIDMSAEAIEVARGHAEEQDLSIVYELTTIEEHAASYEGKYDIVTCMEMLEHVPDPFQVIAACARLLKPDGHLFLSTLNRNWKSYLYAILGAEYLLKILPAGTHQYAKFLKPSELFDMIQQVDLRLISLAGITYHPINKSYRLTHDVSVNYLVHCAK